MALFIVLWMMNSSNAVKQSITGYFHDPKGYKRDRGAGPANAGEGLALNAANMARIRERIEEAMRQMPDFQTMRDHVKLTVTGEGLRIDLMETEQGMFFIAGSPNPTEAGTHLLARSGHGIEPDAEQHRHRGPHRRPSVPQRAAGQRLRQLGALRRSR